MVQVRRSQAYFCTLLCGLAYLKTSLANTEIVNFGVRPQSAIRSLPQLSSWPRLDASRNGMSIQMESAPLYGARSDTCNDEDQDFRCKYQHWFVLDLDDPKWLNYDSFTFRLSWPASLPTDFDIKIVFPDDLHMYDYEARSPSDQIEKGTISRLAFARVAAWDTGIRSPHSQLSFGGRPAVVLNVVLEPLLLGLLPTSIVPILFFLFTTLTVTGLLIPIIFKHLRHISDQAEKELNKERKTM